MSRSTASTALTEPKWRETCLKETAGVMVQVLGFNKCPLARPLKQPPSPRWGEEGTISAAPVG
jgi:hypothetical protein